MFRAYDATRERLVAVKLFKLDLPPERVHQLVAELERLVDAQLDHPALAAPLGAGIVGVSAYLAQEYVAADSLDSVVREYGPAPPADALRVAAQLAGALDFAGVVNIAHGAMHPRDVLLSSDETRLTGVGVARALEKVGVSAPMRRPYTAPERVAGGAWDRRADVFSLAAVIHELLWAKRPSGTGARAAEALTEIELGDVDVLRDVFARALADSPSERFATALEFAEALSKGFPGVTITPPEPRDRTAPPVRAARGDEPLLPLDTEGEPGPPVARTIAPPPAMPPSTIPALLTPPAPPPGTASATAPVLPAPPTPPPTTVPALLPRLEAEAAVPPIVPEALVAPAPDLVTLEAAEEARYRDVEVAPAIVEEAEQAEPIAPAASADTYERPPISALERSRSAVWPLVMALGVGLAIGFAGGYGVGTHSRADDGVAAGSAPSSAPADPAASPQANTPSPTTPPTPSAKTSASAAHGVPPATPGREFTENTVPPPPKPAPPKPVPPPASHAPATASAQEAGRLLVRTTPAGARVTVDGKDYGRSPVAVRDLAHGTHRVRVMRDGYAPVERRVVISAARPAQSLTIPLAADAAPGARGAAPTPAPAATTASAFAGSLIVDSRPPGAKVYVDGKLAGTTPLTMTGVRAGEHAIRIERDGYRLWTSSARVVAAEQNRVTASLER